MPPVQRSIRTLALVVSALVLLTGLGLGGLAVSIQLFIHNQKPAWMLFGFEVVVVAAAVLGVLFGLGKFGDGPGLALGCVSGTILAASALGWLSANKTLGGHSITPVLGFRVVAAMLLGLGGAACVLSRDSRSWRLAALGVGLGLPCLLSVLAFLNAGTRRAIEGAISKAGTLGTIASLVGLVVLGALLCASVHLIVRAFELGRVEPGKAPVTPPAR